MPTDTETQNDEPQIGEEATWPPEVARSGNWDEHLRLRRLGERDAEDFEPTQEGQSTPYVEPADELEHQDDAPSPAPTPKAKRAPAKKRTPAKKPAAKRGGARR